MLDGNAWPSVKWMVPEHKAASGLTCFEQDSVRRGIEIQMHCDTRLSGEAVHRLGVFHGLDSMLMDADKDTTIVDDLATGSFCVLLSNENTRDEKVWGESGSLF